MLFKLINILLKVQNLVFSTVIKTGFAKAGNNFYIEYPARLRGGKYISIGKGFYCFGSVRLEAFDRHNKNFYNPVIVIGDNVSINFNSHIACINKIVIGNNVLLASRVFITDHSHGEINAEALKFPPSNRKIFSKGPVIIEDNVWIGEGACIMPNITIGANSIIGANAVVTKSFPPNSIIGGVPAKLIRSIDPEF